MIKYLSAYIILMLNINILFAQDTAVLRLIGFIDSMMNDKSLAHTSWGICVMNTESNDVIAEYNSQQSLIPASTFKLVTSGAAMNLLGHDYRFVTMLQYDGKIESDGVLKGNIYIKGSGDPSFASTRFGQDNSQDTIFSKWLAVLKAKKIKKLTGAVIGDPGIFDEKWLPAGWMWYDIGNYYGAGASGLNVNENRYYVWFRPGSKIGDTAGVVRIDPLISKLQYINHVRTAASGTGDNVYIYGSPLTYLRFFEGTVPLGGDFPVRGSVPDPAYLCASLFHKYLVENGIEVCLEPTTTVLDSFKNIPHSLERKPLSAWDKFSLTDIMTQLNYWSINVYAESMVKVTGKEINGEGSYKAGVKAITDYLKDNDIDVSGLVIDDGSGLSHLNRITTFQLARILSEYTRDSEFPYFYKTLPVAGNSGTMTYVLKGTIADGRLRAKSGSLEDAKAYAGYIKDKNGEMLSFSMIFNAFNGPSSVLQKKMEMLMLRIAEL